MTHTEELLALAEAATPGPWHADGEHEAHDCVCTKTFCVVSDGTAKDVEFIAAANPETIKQMCLREQKLVELVRLQHETLLELEPYIPANVTAIEAFNKWENGE